MSKRPQISLARRRKLYRAAGYRCAGCGVVGREERRRSHGYGFPTDIDGVFLSADHIVARANGGSDADNNLQVLCTRCNTIKGTRAQ